MGEYKKSKKFIAVAWLSIAVVTGLLLLALVRPTVGFQIRKATGLEPASNEFVDQLRIASGAAVYQDCRTEVLTNGEVFYEAELEAIGQATDSIYVEVYIFEPGRIADRFRAALTERARAGVNVYLIIDAVGSMNVPDSYFDELTAAGGNVATYHQLQWHTWDRVNNRTHREVYIVDNRIAFLGGAGIGDQWWLPTDDLPAWRDTMVRLEGTAVESATAVFLENWVEATGEILVPTLTHSASGPESGGSTCVVVGSTPSFGGSTRARMIYQFFVESAQESILINNPYFLPDQDLRQGLVRAAKRGVEIRLVLPGDAIDWGMTRSASRRNLGELLEAGISISEYHPTMNHRKVMIVDGLWSLVGSTNLDSRSFTLNDEINLIARDPELAGRLGKDFESDFAESDVLTHEEWEARPWIDRVQELLSTVLIRQQ